VVAKLRRRNTLIGGLVLLLLGASMSVIVLASHRAQRLAKLEMGFVASVSHELRTPLSAILSAGENIADGLIDTKAGLARYGAIITSQTSQLIDLVDQVLRFSATRDGSQHYQLQPLEIPDLLESLRENTAGLVLAAGFYIGPGNRNWPPPRYGRSDGPDEMSSELRLRMRSSTAPLTVRS